MPAERSLTVGIDVGGTFTDLLAIDSASGVVKLAKVPTTVDNQAIGFMAALAQAGADPATLQAVVHGTTTTTISSDEREVQPGRPRDVLGAPHEKPAALEAQLDAAQLGYGIVGLVLVAIVAYRRAVALASVVRACLDRRGLWPPMWPPWRDSGREGERAVLRGAHIDIRDGRRAAVEV